MRALVVGNGNDFDPGFVGHRFRELGYVFTEAHRERPAEWPSLDDVELVLLLGSEWNVYNGETAELVDAEADLVRDAVARDVPLFGICFGAQVVAHALGGQVTRTDRPEIGWYEVEALDGCPAEAVAGPWVEWHYDVFTTPDGFAELARTDVGPQVIRRGRVLATQFHPECTETMLAGWLRQGGAEQYRAYGRDPSQFLAETRANTGFSRPNAAALVDWFVREVAPR